MEIPDLPQGAFEHCGDGKIKPQGGGGGGGDIFSPITDPISSALGTDGGGGGILGAAEDLVQGTGSALAEVDKFVGREIPGGWVTPALITAAIAAPYAAPYLAGEGAGAAAFTGATETGLATLAGEAAVADTVGATLLSEAATAAAADAVAEAAAAEVFGQALPYTEAFDAVQLSKQGLTPSQIGTTLSTSGVDPAIGQYMGELASQGLSPEAIAEEIAGLKFADPSQYISQDVMQQARSGASIYQGVPSGVTPGQVLQGLRVASGLLGGRQQPQQQIPQMQMGGRTQMPQGNVDYSGLYNLLALQRARNPNSLLG
jgi:hypothetical protein